MEKIEKKGKKLYKKFGEKKNEMTTHEKPSRKRIFLLLFGRLLK